jgi:gliding motility-associated-like protein
MKNIILLLSLTFLSVFTAESVFSQTLIGNPTDNEAASNVVADNAGNTYVGGMQNKKGLIVKQNAAHVILWSKTLTLTSDPTNEVIIHFLDVIGDTLFGCGKIQQLNQSQGTFYFKMNAQTGAFYWSKFEQSPNRYFSCMRYAKGKYFLVGGVIESTYSTGNVQAVSSETGQGIWRMDNVYGPYNNLVPIASDSAVRFFSSTEMINGKMFVLGASESFGNNNLVRIPLVVGIDEFGFFFLESYITQSLVLPTTNQYDGGIIEYDQNKNLIMEIYGAVAGSNTPRGILLKCDTLGNLIFAKYYEIPSNSSMSMLSWNETPTSYVIFGDTHGGFNGVYALKVAKNGTFQKCVGITKPNVSYENGWSNDLTLGNSNFLNGQHHFSTTEYNSNSLNSDINQVILDANLNLIDDNCSDIVELFPVMMDISTSIHIIGFYYEVGSLLGGTLPAGIEFWDPFTSENESFAPLCSGLSVNTVQDSGCIQSMITANTTGFTAPIFYWSNGTSTSINSINVSTTDTIFLHILDTRCCELWDTIVPFLTPSSLVMSLPSDTAVCMQTGSSIAISPTFSGENGPIQYVWSNNSVSSSLPVINSGIYWVDVSDNCVTKRDSIVMVVNYFPELDLPTNLDTCFDIGVGFSYTALGSGGSYQWSSGSQTATEWISQEGVYSCTLTNVCGSITDSMRVRRLTAVDLYFPADSILECEKQLSVSNLQIETNYNLEIFASNGDLIGTILTESGWYTVHAFNACGEKWDSIYVNLQNEQFFYLPNSFTPNGDSYNDRFEFKGENIIVREIRIFNRWGEEVFSEVGNFAAWDGVYHGESCPDGVYAVHVIYEDCFGIPTEFNGHVNLIK